MTRRKRLPASAFMAALMAAALTACAPSSDTVERASVDAIREAGELVVLTLDGPTTYDPDTGTGYEADLASAFAAHLGVTARFETRRDIESLILALERGEADLAAANLTITPERRGRIVFGPAYKAVTEQLVCHPDGRVPTDHSEISEASIRVLAGSSYVETLETLVRLLPDLRWQARTAGSAMPLLDGVAERRFDCTLADSHLVDFARRRHPDLIVAMNLTGEQPLAWAHSGRVEGLGPALATWFAQAHGDGYLETLDETWFGRFGEFDYVDVAAFVDRVQERLPDYRDAFEEAAEELPFEWELLAAQAYQESHWDADAVSATGVRGLMMLTLSTAERVGIEDRTDPFQSIEGGATYLADLYDRVPADVTGEDRIWFTLAAYNIGMGHMYDARALAERLGRDKNSWDDLAATLPLLSDPDYYETLRYGYARGLEPVRYVEKIRAYRAMLAAQELTP
jgi:membrane-bound lytic murein transglycosylase F